MRPKKREEEQSTTPNLPQDIVEDILKRLPVKTLIRFTCVCKQWHRLVFSDHDFDRGHSYHAKRSLWRYPQCIEVPADLGRGTPYAVPTVDCDGNQEIVTFNNAPVERGTFFEPTEILGSCNGLLFVNGWFRLYTNWDLLVTSNSKFALWNPYANSIKIFHQPFAPPILASGLCFDSAGNDYKAIVLTYVITDESWMPQRPKEDFYVFSLRKNSWRRLNSREFLNKYSFDCNPATTVGGVPYWIAQRDFRTVIVWFDLVTEKFKEVALPDKMLIWPIGLGELGDRLSVISLQLEDYDTVDLWVMKEHGEKESWDKLYSLGFSRRLFGWSVKPLGYSSTGDAVLLECSDRYSPGAKQSHEIWNFNIKDATGTKILEFQKESRILVLGRDAFFGAYFQTAAYSTYSETLLCPWDGRPSELVSLMASKS